MRTNSSIKLDELYNYLKIVKEKICDAIEVLKEVEKYPTTYAIRFMRNKICVEVENIDSALTEIKSEFELRKATYLDYEEYLSTEAEKQEGINTYIDGSKNNVS